MVQCKTTVSLVPYQWQYCTKPSILYNLALRSMHIDTHYFTIDKYDRLMKHIYLYIEI